MRSVGAGWSSPSRPTPVVVARCPRRKTTLIRRAVDRHGVRVVDTDDRDAVSRVLLYLGHATRGSAPVATPVPPGDPLRGTHPAARRAIAALAALRGPLRTSSCSTPAATRPRPASTRADARSPTRWTARWPLAAPDGAPPATRGWASIVTLDRTQAARIQALAFRLPRRAARGGGYHLSSPHGSCAPTGDPRHRHFRASRRSPAACRALVPAESPEVTATWPSKRSLPLRAS